MASVHWIIILTIAAFSLSVNSSKLIDSLQPSIDDYFVPRQDMQDLNPPNYDEYSEMIQGSTQPKYPSFYSLKELLALNAIRNAVLDSQARRLSSVHSRQTAPDYQPNEIPAEKIIYQKHIQQHEQKRNAGNGGYMALCHFKICNMGRKRNTRFLHL